MKESDDYIKVYVVRWIERPRWYMQYTDPVSGKCIRKSSGETRKAKADRVAAKWEIEINAGHCSQPKRLTWRQFIAAYEREAYPRLSKSSQTVRDTVFGHLEKMYSPRNLEVLATARMMSDFQVKLRNVVGSESTIHAYLSHFKSVLNWAKEQGIIQAMPKIKLPKLDDNDLMRGRAISEDEFKMMTAAVPLVRKYDADQWQSFLHGLWLSGLRLNEALALSWDKSEAFRIDVSGIYPQFRIPGASQKNRKGQLVPMAKDFWEWLAERTPMQKRHGHVLKLRALGPDRRPTENQLSEKRACRNISKIGRKAGILTNEDRDEYASAHDLRRSFGLRWKRIVEPYELQKMMRHSKLETTLKYYATEQADDVSARIWAACGKSGSDDIATGKQDEPTT